MMGRWWYMALVLAAGCGAGVVQFRPTERAMAESPQGNVQAVYELTGPQGRAGEAKIWTPGVRNENGRAVVPIGIEIENTGPIPIAIELDSLRLSGVQTSQGAVDASIPTTSVTGAAEVAPRSVGDLGLVFTLPQGIDPRDVLGFRLEWTARIGPEAYAQFTPFVQTHRGRDYYYGDQVPFAPYYGGPWGGLWGGLWMGYPFGFYGCPSWYGWDCWPSYYYGYPYAQPYPDDAVPPGSRGIVPRRPISPLVAPGTPAQPSAAPAPGRIVPGPGSAVRPPSVTPPKPAAPTRVAPAKPPPRPAATRAAPARSAPPPARPDAPPRHTP